MGLKNIETHFSQSRRTNTLLPIILQNLHISSLVTEFGHQVHLIIYIVKGAR